MTKLVSVLVSSLLVTHSLAQQPVEEAQDPCNINDYQYNSCPEYEDCFLCYKFWYMVDQNSPPDQATKDAACQKMASVINSLRQSFGNKCIFFKAETKFVGVNNNNPGVEVSDSGAIEVSDVSQFHDGQFELDFKINRASKMTDRCKKVVIVDGPITGKKEDGSSVPLGGATSARGAFLQETDIAILASTLLGPSFSALTIMHETLHSANMVAGEDYDDHAFDTDGSTALPPGNVMNSMFGIGMTPGQRNLLQDNVCEKSP